MPKLVSRRALLRSGILALLAVDGIGCGTILHPERRGQPAGPLDWSIVLLDAIGLLFFFIPGVIAFAVDFSNGTIYLPTYPTYYRTGGRSQPADNRLSSVRVPHLQRTPEAVAQAVSEQFGRRIELAPGGYRTRELSSLDEFWETHRLLAARGYS